VKRLLRDTEISTYTAKSAMTVVLAALVILLVGCGGSDDLTPTWVDDGLPEGNPPENGLDSVKEFICFIFSLFNPDCLNLEPLESPDPPYVDDTVVIFTLEASNSILNSARISWEPITLTGEATYTVWYTQVPSVPWEDTAISQVIPPGLFFWQIDFPAGDNWYLRMTVEIEGWISDWSNTIAVQL